MLDQSFVPFQYSGNSAPSKDSASESAELSRSQFTLGVEDAAVVGFKIDVNSHLPEFSNDFVDAFAIATQPDSCTQETYALLFKKNFPIRFTEILLLKALNIEGLLSPIECGITRVASFNNEVYFVAIMPMPRGRSLASLIAANVRFDEPFVMQKVFMPLLEILHSLHQQNIAYGKLNLETIYIDEADGISLAECASEVCGYSQKAIFETTERAQVSAFGKGSAKPNIDYYALGVLVFCLLSGKTFSDMDATDMVLAKLKAGTYTFFSKETGLGLRMSELCKAILVDNLQQRWGYEEITNFMSSDKGSMLAPQDKSYHSRAILFNGREFYSKRALVVEMARNWDLAREFIKTDKIRKWVQSTASEESIEELLNSVNFHITTGKVSGQKVFALDDERLIRVLMILDPDGPVRMKDIAFFYDSLGLKLLNALNTNKSEHTQLLLGIVVSNVLNTYEHIATATNNQEYARGMSVLYRCAEFVRRADVGFGVERCMYELNPGLLCQNKIAIAELAINVKEVLLALEESCGSFRDIASHKLLSCFLASRMKASNEYFVKNLAPYHTLYKSKEYQLVNLLAMVQRHYNVGPLSNILRVCQEALQSVLEGYIKSNNIKTQLFSRIQSSGKDGKLMDLLKAASSTTLIAQDAEGFKRAIERVATIGGEVMECNNRLNVNNEIRTKSLRVAVQFSYILCCFVLIMILLRGI